MALNISRPRRFTVVTVAIGHIKTAALPIFMLLLLQYWQLQDVPKSLVKIPEFITPQDGHDKQDCENAAAKRWIAAHPREPQDPPVTLLGDDLYCNQPICEKALNYGYHFIFVCKRSSHPEVYDWVVTIERVGEVQTLTEIEFHGRKRLSYHYRFVNKIPLRATQPALDVNWCEVTVTDTSNQKTLYYNAFATCHEIHAQNVSEIVTAGRARWKVENEGNNILKTKVTRYLWFESWQTLFEFMLREGKAPDGVNSS